MSSMMFHLPQQLTQSREQAAFQSTQNNTTSDQTSEALRDAGQSSNNAPRGGDERDPPRRGELLDDQVAW